MGIFAWAKRKFRNLGVNDPKAWNTSLWNLFGAQSSSGENVTETTALTYSAVFNAVTLISGTISSLPLHLMQRKGRDNEIAYSDPSYRVLHSRANPYMNAKNVRDCFMSHILTWGNGYAEKVYDGAGNLAELWPIVPNRVYPEMIEGKLLYRITMPSGEQIYLPRENILHLHGLGFDGFVGYSVVNMARKSIGLGMAMETFGEMYFKNGINPSAVVTHPNQVNAETAKAMRKALSESYAGLGNSRRLMLLEEGMDIKSISINPEDSQFLESRQFQIPEIARWFNLPPHKLKDLTKSSFSNIESEQISFLIDSILPWLVELEQSYNMQLISDRQIKAGFYYKHVFEGLLRANSKDRAEYYKLMIGTGAMTPNRAIMLEGGNPSSDPLMDENWMPTGLIPVSRFGEYLSKNNTPQVTKELPQNNLKLIANKEK